MVITEHWADNFSNGLWWPGQVRGQQMCKNLCAKNVIIQGDFRVQAILNPKTFQPQSISTCPSLPSPPGNFLSKFLTS